MAEIMGIDRAAKRWAEITPTRTSDYEYGVKNPKRDWAAATIAAKETWKAAMQKVIAEDRQTKGVQRAGTAAWIENTVAKGTGRWGSGVAIAQDKWAERTRPYFDEIARVSLPARMPSGHPNNIDRVKKIAEALHAKKVGK